MYTSDQIEGENPCGESFDKRQKIVCFDLPHLPSRLKNSTIVASTKVIEGSADKINPYTTGQFFLDTEYDLEVAASRVAACVSPIPLPKMETLNVNTLLEQPLQTITSTKQKENTEAEMLHMNNVAIQSPFELPFRPKRRNSQSDEIRFSDIIGHASVKLRIDELILPLGLPSIIAETVLKGIRSIPASILLYGPPGCGKTKLARAIAGEARSAFVSVAPSDILSKFVGESEESIRNIFRGAVHDGLMCNSKSVVIFFDEIDALGQSRESKSSGEGEGCSRRVLSELLLLLNIVSDNRECSIDDFNSCHESSKVTQDQCNYSTNMTASDLQNKLVHVIVVAATNRIEDCDSALLRRFGIQLEVGLPALKDRKKMLIRHLKDIEHTLGDNEIQTLAVMTEQWSGSSLERLAREACMCPIRECLHKAAVIRRRSEKREQQTGDVSGQRDGPESPDVAANSCLLESFQRLRPVTIDDFRRAIGTLVGEDITLTMPTRFGAEKRMKRSDEHYDSSSSSSDDEH